MKRLHSLVPAVVLGAVLIAGLATAAPTVIAETDAGQTLATAQDLRTPSPYELLINGRLSNEPSSLDRIDMYRISVGHQSFLTWTTDDPGLVLADPVLYLFSSTGRGIAMDDESGGNGQAFMSLFLTSGLGDYFVAIAFAGMEPLDGLGNPIFDTFGSGAVLSADPLADWLAADGLVPNDPGVLGAYSLNISVPTPGTLVLAGLALFGLARGRRKLVVAA